MRRTIKPPLWAIVQQHLLFLRVGHTAYAQHCLSASHSIQDCKRAGRPTLRGTFIPDPVECLRCLRFRLFCCSLDTDHAMWRAKSCYNELLKLDFDNQNTCAETRVHKSTITRHHERDKFLSPGKSFAMVIMTVAITV